MPGREGFEGGDRSERLPAVEDQEQALELVSSVRRVPGLTGKPSKSIIPTEIRSLALASDPVTGWEPT